MEKRILIDQKGSQRTLTKKDIKVKPKELKLYNKVSNGYFHYLCQNNSLQNQKFWLIMNHLLQKQ